MVINGEKEYRSSTLYLAVGNSARDSFEMFHKKGIAIEQKPILVGVRVEHPAETINLIRYGNKYKEFPGIGLRPIHLTTPIEKQAVGCIHSACAPEVR